MYQAIPTAENSPLLRDSVAQCGELIGYCRVSTGGQERNGYSLDDQRQRLLDAGCKAGNIYSDTASGAKADRAQLTRMLDRLERRGLVRRVARPNDRRASNLELTAEGKAVYPQLQAAGMKVLNGFLRGFTQKEARQLESFLQRILENA